MVLAYIYPTTAPPQVPKTLCIKRRENCGNLFESPRPSSCSCGPRETKRVFFKGHHAAHWLAHPPRCPRPCRLRLRCKSQESGPRTAVRASNHRPPSTVRRTPVIASRIHTSASASALALALAYPVVWPGSSLLLSSTYHYHSVPH